MNASGHADPAPHVVRRGTGLPVLMIHGNGVDHRLLLGLDHMLADHGFERIYLDLPGFGRTPMLPRPGDLPALADWLDAAAEDLVGERSFAVLGNSMGGLLAADLTARRPGQVRGMALLAPVVEPVRSRRRLPERTVLGEDPQLLAAITAQDPEAAAQYLDMAVVQSRYGWERYRQDAFPGSRAASRRAMAQLETRYELAADGDLPTRLRGYTGQVLVVAGRQDHVVGHEDQAELASHLEHASLAVLDGAGHNVFHEQPAVTAGLLADWGRRVLATH